jgi:enoyl-[acyl-carrier protein] reductase II
LFYPAGTSPWTAYLKEKRDNSSSCVSSTVFALKPVGVDAIAAEGFEGYHITEGMKPQPLLDSGLVKEQIHIPIIAAGYR